MADTKIDTPCIQVCSMDESRGMCIGCGRTRAEIARWGVITPAERRAIMSQLADRLDDVARPMPQAIR